MIKVTLKGGLGNQMFQYAFGKSLALEKKEGLVLETSFLNCRIPIKYFTIRNYELDLFDIPEKLITSPLSRGLNKYVTYPFQKLLGKFNPNYLTEKADPYYYNKTLINHAMQAKDNIILEGYWNNYKYFEKHQKKIKSIFDTSKLYDEKFKQIEKQINSSNSVSINIRRGDYLNAKHKYIFVSLDERYYKKAIEIIKSKIENPHFFIFAIDFPEGDYSYFTDELGLKKSQITLLGKEYVGDRFKTYLRLISLCNNNIIANSTFSFWGAYLNSNRNKIVIGPQKWMHGFKFENPKGWLTIRN